MRHTQRTLLTVFLSFLAVCAVLVAVYETGLLPEGVLFVEDRAQETIVLSAMELLTIGLIPLALRLFHMQRVARRLTTPERLLRWGLLRLLMLCLPMAVNTLLYYLYMNVAFGYMAIILLLCLGFVVPTQSRCENELYQERETEA